MADAVKPDDYGSFDLRIEADYHSILRSRASDQSDQISEVAAGQALSAYATTYPPEEGDQSGADKWYYAQLDLGFTVDGWIAGNLVHELPADKY